MPDQTTCRATLLADGSSDSVLEHILKWLWDQHFPEKLAEWKIADLRLVKRDRLEDRIKATLEIYPTDVLFIHRDAEKEPWGQRQQQILAALSAETRKTPSVSIIPVRMTEAWLLSDELAIRKAAGNPNGSVSLSLPAVSRLESIPDPKAVLHNLLTTALEGNVRRRAKFNTYKAALLVSQYTKDFSALRKLEAFQQLEQELQQVVAKI